MMSDKSSKKSGLNFRKTALSKQGAFTPARQGMRAGVGVNSCPAPVPKTADKKGGQ